MTNQEAITWLAQLSAGIEWELDMNYAAALDMAIEALKAQEVKNSTDAINRQDAIDAIEVEKTKCGDYLTSSHVGYEIAEEVVAKLPSVQPLIRTEMSSADDTISRHGAIDAINEQIKQCDKALSSFDISMKDEYAVKVERASLVAFRETLECIPSVQPERPKGEWIPVDSYSAFGGDEATWMAHGNPVAFYYCSECKEQAYAGEDGESLITDYCPNCGADMKGEP